MCSQTTPKPDQGLGREFSGARLFPQERRSLFAGREIQHFDPDSVVVWEGDRCSQVFEVVSGMLRIVKSLSGGRRAVVGFNYPGDLFGVGQADPLEYSVEAVTPTRLRRCDRSHFDSQMDSMPELRPLLVGWLCEEIAAARAQMVLLGRKTAEERVCSFLVLLTHGLHGRRPTGSMIEIVMPRLDIADYLGMTKETLSRTLARLTALRVIRLSGRHTIVVRALAQLEARAGDGSELEHLAGATAKVTAGRPVSEHSASPGLAAVLGAGPGNGRGPPHRSN